MYPNHPGQLTIAANTTEDISNVMCDTHTEDLCVLRELMGVDQNLIQYIFADLNDAYQVYIRERNTNLINMPISEFLTHL